MITPAQLKAIVPSLKTDHATVLSGLINEIAPKYGINTPIRLCAFLAQTAHESAGFTAKAENLNYSAKNLLATFHKYFPTATDAASYANKPEKIANHVYCNRMGNGNEASGDGYHYRGAGFIQITGKEMYMKYAAKTGQDVATIADLMRNDERWAMDSAAWFFGVEKSLLDEADRGDLVTISIRINGGTIGLNERKALYEQAKKTLMSSKTA